MNEKVKSEIHDTVKFRHCSDSQFASSKVFYIPEEFLRKYSNDIKLELFYHPRKETSVLFLTGGNKKMMEIVQYSESFRCWFINNDVCSDGKIFVATPLDTTFLALHHIRKHCKERALALDSIRDESDQSVARLFREFIQPQQLGVIADVKTAGDLQFYKYNNVKARTWLALKTHRVAAALKADGIHCGQSALSENFVKTSEMEEDDEDYLQMAYEVVSDYVDLELRAELREYLNLPVEEQLDSEEVKQTTQAGKRKSIRAADSSAKKIKIETTDEGATADESSTSSIPTVSTKLFASSEPVLTTKQKALAKSAKGTKSIAAFFKK